MTTTPHLQPKVKVDAGTPHLQPRVYRPLPEGDGVPVASVATTEPLTVNPSPVPSPSVTLVTIPEPTDAVFAHGGVALPDWVSEIRPHQWECASAVVDGFNDHDVMFLDGPTGSGKTLIAELVRRMMGVKALYVCSDKSLQDQFAGDYKYSKVLKGKSNYTPLNGSSMVSCADCTKGGGPCHEDRCKWCSDVCKCPYLVAKTEAQRSQLAVINTSYLLYEGNYVGAFSDNPLVIADECDELEHELLSFSEFAITQRLLDTLELDAPVKGAHQPTIIKWIAEELTPALAAEMARKLKGDEDELRYMRHIRAVSQLYQDSLDAAANFDDGWVRDYKANMGFLLKPITVERYGRRHLWRHGDKWLAMSATIVSDDEMAHSLGLEYVDEANIETQLDPIPWATVRAPMTFPVEHRPIYVCNLADMTRKGQEAGGVMDLMQGIQAVLNGFPTYRTLIHSHSYALTDAIVQHLYNAFPPNRPRKIITYKGAQDRVRAMREYRESEGSIMIAPSMDRGVDFPNDMCRVQIVAKMPMPYLGDTQVAARLHATGGETWYAAQTARSLVQSTGRGVRHKDDWCLTYILDKSFFKFKKKNKGLLPEWWQDAIQVVKQGQLGSQPTPQ